MTHMSKAIDEVRAQEAREFLPKRARIRTLNLPKTSLAIAETTREPDGAFQDPRLADLPQLVISKIASFAVRFPLERSGRSHRMIAKTDSIGLNFASGSAVETMTRPGGPARALRDVWMAGGQNLVRSPGFDHRQPHSLSSGPKLHRCSCKNLKSVSKPKTSEKLRIISTALSGNRKIQPRTPFSVQPTDTASDRQRISAYT